MTRNNYHLQANDRELKAELGRLVEVELWDAARTESAAQQRVASSRADVLSGELEARRGMLGQLQAQVSLLRP